MPEKTEAYLVTPRRGPTEEIIRYFDLYSEGCGYPKDNIYHLFVPERFVLGEYEELGTLFQLNKDKISFKESPFDLAEYLKALKQNKLKTVISLELTEYVILEITRKGRDYTRAKENLIGKTNNLIGGIHYDPRK